MPHISGAACDERLLRSTAISLVRTHPGRPAAHPTATGWDEGLLGRASGVRHDYRGTGAPSLRLGRIHACVRTGTDGEPD